MISIKRTTFQSELTLKPEGGERALVEAPQVVQLDGLRVYSSRKDEALGIEGRHGPA